MLTYEQIYAQGERRTIRQVQALVREHCPHILLRWQPDWQQWRIAYKGLKPEREEAMASYVPQDDYSKEALQESYADVLGTAITMERDYLAHVFEADKLKPSKD